MKKLRDDWISVEDAMPNDFDEVLILFEKGGYFRRRVVVGHRWRNEWHPYVARKFRVTHWQPIPYHKD